MVRGATSDELTSDLQRESAQKFEQELVAHYQPSSPLELLQIRTIALCKVKLEALCELEQVKLQIVSVDLRRSPELMLQRLPESNELVEAIATKLSAGTIRELAEEVMRAVGFSGRIVYDSTKPDGTPRKLLDVSAAKAQGWQARVTLSEGIELAYRDFLTNHAHA